MGKWLILGLRQVIYKMSLGRHFIVQKRKNTPRSKGWGHVRGAQEMLPMAKVAK